MAKSLVGRFEHLLNRPRSNEAIPLLEKIASQVKPIMSKRSWSVGTLAEFLPSNPALLGNNMNAGQWINLRLRPPGDTSSFYEWDQLVLVMLHELTHIEHNPHNAQFYKLLAELEEEYYDLKRKGYSGEGFHGAGNHLPGLKLNEYEGRAKGLSAAQKRLDTQRKIGKGGVLGGSGTAGKTMKEVLAEAAERRLRDDKACHPEDEGHTREIEEEVRKAAEESGGVDAVVLENRGTDIANEETAASASRPILIDNRDRQSQAIPSGDRSQRVSSPANPPMINGTHHTGPRASQPAVPKPLKPSKSAKPSPTRSLDDSVPIQPPPQPVPPLELPTGEWSCPLCTLFNPSLALTCEACTTPRPRARQKGAEEVWYCEFCGVGPREMGFWSCGECGWVRKWG